MHVLSNRSSNGICGGDLRLNDLRAEKKAPVKPAAVDDDTPQGQLYTHCQSHWILFHTNHQPLDRRICVYGQIHLSLSLSFILDMDSQNIDQSHRLAPQDRHQISSFRASVSQSDTGCIMANEIGACTTAHCYTARTIGSRSASIMSFSGV